MIKLILIIMLTVICEDWHSTLLWKTLVLPYHFFASLKLLEPATFYLSALVAVMVLIVWL